MEERPLECSECKKDIAVQYTEIVNNNIVHTCMCAECPILQQRMHGIASTEDSEPQLGNTAGLCCGNCDTNLETVRTGNPLGCEECYDVFADVLIMEMQASNKVSQRLFSEKSKKSMPIHIGRSPGESTEINPSIRLIALNEALNEVLLKEDYEQAAWLRDQIKELTEQTENAESSNEKK
jgi:protein arginine kinase activator